MTARFKDHILGPDTHANRPAASGVPEAALYECTTHGLIYKNVAGTWVTYGVLIPPGGTTAQALVKNSNTDFDIGWGAGGGGGSTPETFDAAVAAVTGAVHRYKFDETSGATIADSIGSLNLTLSGTEGTAYTRNITGPTGFGKACQFINAHADSGSIGSVPVGSNDRTVVFIFRTSSTAAQTPFCYGTAAAYQIFYPQLNINGITATNSAFTPSVGGGSDLMSLTQVPIPDGAWHMGAMGLRGSGKNRFGYLDAVYAQMYFTTAANTVSTGFFRVGQVVDGTNPMIGDLADLVVFNRALSRAELDRLFRAAAL